LTPWLTAACAARSEEIFGGPANPKASETNAQVVKRPWQRKLMAGGACEASVFCQYGYEATCICLPLGNYHNMPHLEALQGGTYDAALLGPARCAREFVHTGDYLGMVELLVALGQKLPEASAGAGRFEKLWAERKYVLG
jgi:endoglucanase